MIMHLNRGTLWLEPSTLKNKGLILSLKPSPFFVIDFNIGPRNVQSLYLIRFKIFNLVFKQRLYYIFICIYMSLLEKSTQVHVEVIDRRLLSFEEFRHKPVSLEITTKN
jgi:hypothetical protein